MNFYVLDLQDESTKREVNTKLSLGTMEYRIAQRDVNADVTLHKAELEMRQQLGRLPRFGLRLAFVLNGYVDDDETYQFVTLHDHDKTQHDTYAWYQLADDELIGLIKGGALGDEHFNERLQDHLIDKRVTIPVLLRTQEYQLSDYDYLAADSQPGLIQLDKAVDGCTFDKLLNEITTQLTTEYQQQLQHPIVEKDETKKQRNTMFVNVDDALEIKSEKPEHEKQEPTVVVDDNHDEKHVAVSDPLSTSDYEPEL